MIGYLKHRTYKLCMILILLFFTFGCTHYYVPREYPVRPGMVPDFSSNNSVKVINAYSSGKIVFMGAGGIHKWMGDLRLWTDTSIKVLKNELQLKKISVTGESSKELRVAVTHANIYFGFSSIRCILSLKVDTGDGYSKEFEGNNTSPWTLYRACDGAVTKAVELMLNDEEILNYIKY